MPGFVHTHSRAVEANDKSIVQEAKAFTPTVSKKSSATEKNMPKPAHYTDFVGAGFAVLAVMEQTKSGVMEGFPICVIPF